MKNVAILKDRNSGWTGKINDEVVLERDVPRGPTVWHLALNSRIFTASQMGFNRLGYKREAIASVKQF